MLPNEDTGFFFRDEYLPGSKERLNLQEAWLYILAEALTPAKQSSRPILPLEASHLTLRDQSLNPSGAPVTLL